MSPSICRVQVMTKRRNVPGETDRKLEGWSFMTWPSQNKCRHCSCQELGQQTEHANASTDAKLSVLAIIRLLQSSQLHSTRLLNHLQMHLEVIQTLINSYVNQTDQGLSIFLSFILTQGSCFICLIFVRASHTIKKPKIV